MFSSSSANISPSANRDRAAVDTTAVLQIVETSSSPQSARAQVEALLRDGYDAVRREAVADRRLADDA